MESKNEKNIYCYMFSTDCGDDRRRYSSLFVIIANQDIFYLDSHHMMRVSKVNIYNISF